MGDNDQHSNTDVDAVMGELTLSSVGDGAGKQVINDDSKLPKAQEEQYGASFLNEFTFIKEIGFGASGNVVEAVNKLDQKHYAIKIIMLSKSKDVNEKVLREVTSMAKLEHDNIVRYHTAWIEPVSIVEKSHLYIQMELCEKTLNDWLFENICPRNRSQVIDYFRQIVSAIDVIHNESLIHRDLKPSNIFLSKNILKVGDFGLVTIHSVLDELEQDAVPGTSSIHSRRKGTRLYMSPEQLEEKDYNCKVDIFALGLIFLELCFPLNVDKREALFVSARQGKFPNEETFPDSRCRYLLDGMLVKNPAKRSTAKQILEHPIFKQNLNANTTFEKQTTNIFQNIQATNLMIGEQSVMNIYSERRDRTKKNKVSPKKPLTKSQEQPSIDQLLDIKEKVGPNWKDLGRWLNVEESVLEQMHEEHQSLSELIYQILRRWIQRENMNATRERLAQVFMKLDRGDLADILSDD